MQPRLSSRLTMSDVPEYLATDIQDWLMFVNPKFVKNERLDNWNGAILEFLDFYEFSNQPMILPRGLIHETN